MDNLKRFCRYLPLLAVVPFCVSLASAQSAVDVNVGFGGAWDSANKSGIDNNTGLSCTPGSASTCQTLPALSAFMLGFGGDVMFKEKFGAGIEYSIQPAKQNYGPLQDRQSFYDFNAIYRPIQTKKAA